MKKNPTLLKGHRAVGFTLFELLITLAILGILSAVALPSYQDHVDSVNVGLATADIKRIEQAIERYYIDTNSYPLNLAEVALGGLEDPWGNAYQYLRFDDSTKTGQKRKDKNLVPVNTDYDLYSMGKDGQTAMPFPSAKGRNDIVRANNGRFVGLAEDY